VFTAQDFFTEWQRRFPAATTHLLPEAGHYVLEDAHQTIAPLVREFMV
jgi:haloalkane dehalogenase